MLVPDYLWPSIVTVVEEPNGGAIIMEVGRTFAHYAEASAFLYATPSLGR